MAIFRGTGGSGTSQDDATISAVTEQAGIATTKAGEAAASATAAATSAVNASGSATNSSASASTSSASATTATTKAGEAVASATAAALSASESATSATAAATSASVANSPAVQTVAGLDTELTSVYNNIDSVTTVSTKITDVSTVAGISADVTTVASDGTDIGIVSANITNVNIVGDDIANINTVALNTANINTVAADASDIGTVAGISSDVSSVANIAPNVTTVSGMETKIDTVIADAADIGTVAGNIGDVSTVAGISGDVDTVAGISADVTSVADNMTAVQNATTSATNAAASAASASNSASAASTSASTSQAFADAATDQALNALAKSLDASASKTAAQESKDAAASSAASAGTSATNAAASAVSASASSVSASNSETAAAGSAGTALLKAAESAASAVESASSAADSLTAANTWTNYYATYLGAVAVAPTLDLLGNPLAAGALYLDTTDNTTYVYTGSAWNAVANNNIINPNVALTQDLATNGNDVKFGDNDKATFGASDDLQIYHNGNSFVSDNGAGNLYLTTNDAAVVLSNADGSKPLAIFNNNADSTVYFNGLAKLATTATGIDVTGTVVANGFSTAGSISMGDILSIQSTTGFGSIEMGGPNGAYIDLKSPFSDDYDSRIFTNGTDLDLTCSTGSIKLIADGGQKLATTATGIDVTGTATMGGLVVNTSSVGGFKITNEATSGVRLTAYQGTTNSNVRTAYVDAQEFVLSTGAPTGTTVTERMRIDSAGRVGIGTSSPTGELHVKSASGNANFYLQRSVYDPWRLSAGSAYLSFMQDSSEKMRIDNAGNVGIGTSSPVYPLVVSNSGAQGLEFIVGTNNFIQSYNRSTADYTPLRIDAETIAFATDNGSERLRIDSAGKVGIGTSSPSSQYFNNLVVGNNAAGDKGITIRSNASNVGVLAFSDTDSADSGRYSGYIAYDHSNNAMRLHTNGGSERMRIDSSGNLLVGTTTAYGTTGTTINAAGLVYSSADADRAGQFDRTTNDGELVRFSKAGTTVGSIGTANADSITIGNGTGNLILYAGTVAPCSSSSGGASDGVVDLGTSARRFKDLYLSGGVYAGSYASFVQGGGNDLFITNSYASGDLVIDSARRIIFKDSGTEAARLDASGNLLVGTTSTVAGGKISAQAVGSNPAIAAQGASDCFQGRTTQTSGTSYFAYWVYNGSAVGSITSTGSSTAYNTSSDQRLKENIADADDAGSKIDAIQVRQYDWKVDGSHQDYGMIAQELQAVAPDAVSGDADSEEMMGVDYSKLVPMLIKEIQSLRNRVAQLETGE